MSATTTVYVGNLDQRYRNFEIQVKLSSSLLILSCRVTDAMLLEYFSPMGSVANIKIVAVSRDIQK